MRRFTLTIFAIAALTAAHAQTVATFESLSLPKADTFYVNYSNSGNDVGFDDGLAHFPCVYNSSWGGFWSSGFAYSNMTDSVTSGFGNQYSAKTAKGYNGSDKYLVSTGSSNYINLKAAGKGGFVKGVYVTNSTYAYNSMRDGDAFAKKFGGATGNDADWFKLVIRGFKEGVLKQDSVEVYLADFRFTDNSKDYILKTWKFVNLMPLGKVDSLDLSLSSSDVGAFGMNTPALYCLDNFTTQEIIAPYAPQATVSGSTAIEKTSSKIMGWGTSCTVNRGFMDIADPSLGRVTSGADSNAIGMSDNIPVSLGDSGVAEVRFNNIIYNGAGADFVVFENGFPNPSNPEEGFLEFAFVEVSSNGTDFFRFPASCLIDTAQVPVAGVYSNAREVNNLAGKYIGGYGTPFDLQELAGTPGLDIDNIIAIRIVDAVGSIGAHGQTDADGRKINDPYPTAIPSGGFDLDAVGALYLKWPTNIAVANTIENMRVVPNPASDYINISFATMPQGTLNASITDVTGKTLIRSAITTTNNSINITSLAKGIYYLTVSDATGNKWVQKISKI